MPLGLRVVDRDGVAHEFTPSSAERTSRRRKESWRHVSARREGRGEGLVWRRGVEAFKPLDAIARRGTQTQRPTGRDGQQGWEAMEAWRVAPRNGPVQPSTAWDGQLTSDERQLGTGVGEPCTVSSCLPVPSRGAEGGHKAMLGRARRLLPRIPRKPRKYRDTHVR